MKSYKYDGSRNFSIKSFDCADKGEFSERHEAIGEFVENLEKINEYQQKLFAEQKEGIIFIFQAMDAAGKDGAVRAVLSCLSPQGVSEHSFKVPSAEENRHDFLWRFWDAIPEKGAISIFNRSYYEDVLVQKVHRLYEKNRYADRIDKDQIIDKRYEQIRNFEKYLWENSIRVVKIFLNVSKDEQGRRFISRIDTPKKNWKFSSGDIDEREYWDDYMQAYEKCINRTARKNAPWYVVPADHKWYARLVISRIVLDELKNMDPKWPVLSDEEMAKLASYRERLVAETAPREKNEEEEDGAKTKPSDTAVGIALKSDRQALSEKKFRKLLKKSVFENFSERFGVSEATQEHLGSIYLNIEEAEAKAEADSLDELKETYRQQKDILEDELKGCGKEARKLLERYKKASHAQIDAFVEELNLNYGNFEEELKQIMTEYEVAVATETMPAEIAISNYQIRLADAYEEHRAGFEELKGKVGVKLLEIADEYSAIGTAFRIEKEYKAAAEAAAEELAEESEELAEDLCEACAEEASGEVQEQCEPCAEDPAEKPAEDKPQDTEEGSGETSAVLSGPRDAEEPSEEPEAGLLTPEEAASQAEEEQDVPQEE